MLQYVFINDHTLSRKGRPSPSSPMFASKSGKHQSSEELPSLPAWFGFIEASLIFLLNSFLAGSDARYGGVLEETSSMA